MSNNKTYGAFNCICSKPLCALKCFKHLLKVWLTGAGFFCILSGITYFIWIYMLEFQYPVPFYGFIFGIITVLIMYIALWFQFSYDLRNNASFYKRMRCFMISAFLTQIISLEFSLIISVFVVIPQYYQWPIAFILPLIREMNIRAVIKVARKSVSGDFAILSALQKRI